MERWFEAGHVAIVTGGSRGLGKALARELLLYGLTVIVDGRDGAVLEAAEAELGEYGAVIAIRGDVADREHAHALVAAGSQRGRLDLLINNASTLGQTPLPRVDELSYETFRHVFDTNVFAPIHLMQHAARLMRRSGGPATIVNIASDAATAAYPGWGGYGASKSALELFSRVFAAEMAGTRIRVLVADPGDMDTQMHRDAIPDADPSELRDPLDAAKDILSAVAGMTEAYEYVRAGARVPA